MGQKSLLPLILTTAFLDLLGFSLLIPVFPDITAHFMQAESRTMWTQSIYSLGMFVAGAFLGNLSDRYGRKNLLIFTTAVNASGYMLIYISMYTQSSIAGFGFGLFLLARFVSGIAGAGIGIVQAYISDISTPENRAKNMGLIGAVFGIAFLVGPALGGILSIYFGIQGILLLSILSIVINFFWIIFSLPESSKQQNKQTQKSVKFHYNSQILFFLILSFFVTVGFSVVQTGSVQYMSDRFLFDSDMRGYTLTVVGVSSILFQLFFIKPIRKILRETQMIVSGLTLLAFSLLFYTLNTSSILIFAIVIFFPIGMGLIGPSLSSQLSELSPDFVGKVMGLNTSMIGVGGIIGPFLVGWLYTIDITLPFGISSVLFLILSLMSCLYFQRFKRVIS